MVSILRDRVTYGIRLLRLIVMRHGREWGRGRKEKSAYHVTLNLSRWKEYVVVVQRHIDVLTMWPRICGGMDNSCLTAASSLYMFIRIHRVLYFLCRRNFTAKKAVGGYLFHYAYLYTTYVLIAVVVVSTHGTYNKNMFPRTSYNVPGSIYN